MAYGGQTQVGQFFTAVAQGFVQTRFEIILFFLIVIAFLVVMVLLFAMQKRQAERDLEGRARRLASRRRRRYVRRKVRLSVLVARDPDAADPRPTTLLDLGGGGASFRNPWEMLRRGDIIHMSFPPPARGPTVTASVVRVSRRGTTIHVKFEFLSESTRDRILQFLRGGRSLAGSGELLGDGDGGNGPVRRGGGDLPVGF
jgi:hypothetical protein